MLHATAICNVQIQQILLGLSHLIHSRLEMLLLFYVLLIKIQVLHMCNGV